MAGQLTEHVILREGKARKTDETFYFANIRVIYEFEHTNLSTGESITHSGRFTLQELAARHVEGDLYEYWHVQAGQPFTVTDEHGNVILRDRGALRVKWQYDASTGRWQLVDTFVHGPHPGFPPPDFCQWISG